MNNEEKILSILETMQADVAELKTDVSGLKTDVAGLKTDVAGLKTDVADLKTDVADLKDRVVKLEITNENIIVPNIKTLAEGHGVILEKLDALAPKNRVEALEDEMAFMKSVIKALSQEVAELKKAQ